MTLMARRVLDDCRVALQLLEEEADAQRWRVQWAAAVALIRAVGHVLDKVDGGNDDRLKRASNRAFKRWKSDDPAHQIFREFIEAERNNVLKEYSSSVHPLTNVSVAIELTARARSDDGGVKFGQVVEIGENIYRPLLDGPWEGDDARDVLTEAIDWWTKELDALDEEVLRTKRTSSE